MIGISKTTQSTDNGALIIREKFRSKINDAANRISRSATLDGGAVIENLGYSDGDRKFEVLAQLEKTKADSIWAIFKSETYINISCIDGFFYGAIERLKIDNGKMKMVILIQE